MDDFPASALVLYGPARPPSVAPPKRKSKFKRDELPEPIPSDPESLQALALHLKETKLFDTDAACKSFATNMFILVRALSPENNALFKKRFPAFVQAIQDPNFKSILRDELFRPEPFFVVLADILTNQSDPTELALCKNISHKHANAEQMKKVAIVLVNSPNLVRRIAAESTSDVWDNYLSERTEFQTELLRAGVNILSDDLKDLVVFLLPKCGSVDKMSDRERLVLRRFGSTKEITAAAAESIGMSLPKARALYSKRVDEIKDYLPWSKLQMKEAVGAEVLGFKSNAKLSKKLDRAKSTEEVYDLRRSNYFKEHYKSLSDVEKTEAALFHDPAADEAIIRAKLAEDKGVPRPKIDIDVSDVPQQQNLEPQTKKLGPNSSKYKGVTKDRKKWKASIKVDSHIYSKVFDTEEDAAQWYAKVDWKYIKKNKIPSSSKARKISISPAHLDQKGKASKKKSKVSAPDSDSDDDNKKPPAKKKAASKPPTKKKTASIPKKSAAASNDSYWT